MCPFFDLGYCWIKLYSITAVDYKLCARGISCMSCEIIYSVSNVFSNRYIADGRKA